MQIKFPVAWQHGEGVGEMRSSRHPTVDYPASWALIYIKDIGQAGC